MQTEQFGIFGGTFAPIHTGHLTAAKAFLQGCNLDTLHIIPTNLPPHKQSPTLFDNAARLEMLRLVTAHELCDERIVIDDYEIQKGGISYTYQTLEHYAAPHRTLWFLCGTDMFLTLSQWKHPDIIFALANIAYVLRGAPDDALLQSLQQAEAHYRNAFGARIVALRTEPIAISSAELRTQLQAGQMPDAYLPQSVQQYLLSHPIPHKGGACL